MFGQSHDAMGKYRIPCTNKYRIPCQNKCRALLGNICSICFYMVTCICSHHLHIAGCQQHVLVIGHKKDDSQFLISSFTSSTFNLQPQYVFNVLCPLPCWLFPAPSCSNYALIHVLSKPLFCLKGQNSFRDMFLFLNVILLYLSLCVILYLSSHGILYYFIILPSQSHKGSTTVNHPLPSLPICCYLLQLISCYP